jgi:hypothetical protein
MEQTAVANNILAAIMSSDSSNDDSNKDLHHDSSSGGLDFLGNGSMKDIAMKMGDIDKVLDEINRIDDKPERSGSEQKGDCNVISNQDAVANPADNSRAYSGSNGPKDIVFDTDDDDEELADLSEVDLAQMQAELKQADDDGEKQQRKQQSPPPPTTNLGKIVTVIVTKPTPESPLGISMKTSKGITWIVGIADTGLLKGSDLRGGLTMRIQTVNGTPIKNARHARSLIQGSQKKVKIVAQEVKQ